MTDPTVSAIVPVYNRGHLVGATLTSLLSQTRPPCEIIVVDDGSSDDSAAVAEAFGPPVRVVRIANGGPARARNVGLAQARGDLVLFFDSDDLATRDYLEARVAALRGRDDIAYGPWLPVEIDGATMVLDPVVRQAGPVDRPANVAFLRDWVLYIPNCLISRTMLEAVGGYPSGLVTGEDVLLMWRLLSTGARLVHTKQSLFLVRQHPAGQISAASELEAQRLFDELTLTRTVLADAVRQSAPAGAVSAWRARRARAWDRAAISQPGGVLDDLRLGPPPSPRERLEGRLDGLARRALTRLRFQHRGHRVHPTYAPARTGAEHLAMVQNLGFTASIKPS